MSNVNTNDDANNNNTAIEWIENTNKRFGQIDTLVNCAGIFKSTVTVVVCVHNIIIIEERCRHGWTHPCT